MTSSIGKKIQNSLGEKSLQATSDANVDSKIRSTENPLKPFLPTSQDYDNRMLLFAFRIGVVFQLRGGTEVRSLFEFHFVLIFY